MTRLDKNIDRSRHPGALTRRRSISLSLRSVAPLLAYLASNGYDADLLRKAAGMGEVETGNPDARISHALAIRLWNAAQQETGDADLGLHVAEAIRPGTFGALEYAVRTSPSLGTGLDRLVRYHQVLHDAAEVGVDRRGGQVVLSHRLPLPGGAPRQVSEYVMAGWLLAVRRLVGDQARLIEARFPHSAPARLDVHKRLFGAPLRFDHHRSELVFPAAMLDQPLPEADPTLQRILEGQLDALVAQLPPAGACVDRVLRVLAGELCEGEPRLEAMAKRLHTTPRTLHRHLEMEGTNFRDLVAATRRELSERYLREGRLTIAEIAFLLGYSEASAFHRAFRRWTGYSPKAFRARHCNYGAS
ncbi:MAG: AraC family transcriptional regulator [Ectothiorhodospiraceae bacterium]|nr:AraC family transcriptional regulator [Ectothiorhodospiraceae bacterium]MCH8502960.1 AraC family transcriptional regulator [Ectothiorhodospiraceae bacterium]